MIAAERELVSVIVPVHNGESFLASTLDSVLQQTYPHFEIVAVNDGSTDRSGEILAAYRDAHPGLVRVIDLPGRGVASARNAGIRAARGAFMALLDHDDLWRSDKLERQVPLFYLDATVGLVYSNVRVTDPDGHDIYRFFDRYPPASGWIAEDLLTRRTFVPCLSAVIRRAVLQDVGLFNPGLSCAEDIDLFIRVARKYRAAYCAEPLGSYRRYPTSFMVVRRADCTAEAVAVTAWYGAATSGWVWLRSRARLSMLWTKMCLQLAARRQTPRKGLELVNRLTRVLAEQSEAW